MSNYKAPAPVYLRVEIKGIIFNGFKIEKGESDIDASLRIIEKNNSKTNHRYKTNRDSSGWFLVDTNPIQNILSGDLATKYIRIIKEGQLYNIKINEGETYFDAAVRMTNQSNGTYKPQKDSNGKWYLLVR
jgi:hypothetical protein